MHIATVDLTTHTVLSIVFIHTYSYIHNGGSVTKHMHIIRMNDSIVIYQVQ